MNDSPGQQREDRGPDGPYVGERVHLLDAPQRLLRRHERRCAHRDAGSGVGPEARGVLQPRDPEVEHLHTAVAHEEDVVGLHVAMNDPGRMRRRQHVQQDVRELQDVRDREPPPEALGPSVGGLALEQLHHEERRAVVRLAVVQHPYDARMIHRIRDVPFAGEAPPDLGICRELRVEDLQRDAVAVAMRRRIHGPHPAHAQQRVHTPLLGNPGADARLHGVVHAGGDICHGFRAKYCARGGPVDGNFPLTKPLHRCGELVLSGDKDHDRSQGAGRTPDRRRGVSTCSPTILPM